MQVRQAKAEELKSGIAPVSHYFGNAPTEENVRRFARVLRPERMHVAEEDGQIVGGASAFEFQFTVPGAISFRSSRSAAMVRAPNVCSASVSWKTIRRWRRRGAATPS